MTVIAALKSRLRPLAAALLAAVLASGCARPPERIVPALHKDEAKTCAELHAEIENEARIITRIEKQLDEWNWSRLDRFRKFFSMEARVNEKALTVELAEHRERAGRLQNVEERRCNLYKKEEDL